jgi:hypothetical protein
MRTVRLALVFLLLPGLVAAQAINVGLSIGFAPRLQVNPISATRFEVIESHGAGAQDIWCAAARYTEDALGKTRGRLYVARARGPAQTAPGQTGVVFSTEPVPDAFTSVSVSVRAEGMNLPIFHARQFCRNHILEQDD